MSLEFYIICLLIAIVAFLLGWFLANKNKQEEIDKLKSENFELSAKASSKEDVINALTVEFSKIAQETLKNQQEQLLHSNSENLKLFKAEEINPINRLLNDFKESIDNYQKSHQTESLEIKNAIQTAEKYAKALTTNQNSKGSFGEEWLEQILKFANLQEHIHYEKQLNTSAGKPDFVIKLPNNNSLIIDSKVILKNYLEFCETNDLNLKKKFIEDLKTCINDLSKRKYCEIEGLNQPEFILMYIPIEPCVNLIYTDKEFQCLVENANSQNIIIVGSSSMLVTLRLVNQLWANKVQSDNINNIISVGENLYKYVTTHANNLLGIRKSAESLLNSVNVEINRLTHRNNGSILKEAEKLREYGLKGKTSKKGEDLIPEMFLQEDYNLD